jgi:hypothetical protein
VTSIEEKGFAGKTGLVNLKAIAESADDLTKQGSAGWMGNPHRAGEVRPKLFHADSSRGADESHTTALGSDTSTLHSLGNLRG